MTQLVNENLRLVSQTKQKQASKHNNKDKAGLLAWTWNPNTGDSQNSKSVTATMRDPVSNMDSDWGPPPEVALISTHRHMHAGV